MNQIEVMRQALEAQDFYEICQQYRHAPLGAAEFEALKQWVLNVCREQAERIKRAEEAFAAASEEMKGEQEPVAWMNDSTPAGVFARHKTGAENFGCTIALYTAPPQRQPLTDEEIWYLASQAVIGGDVHVDKLVRAIEAAHGIGA